MTALNATQRNIQPRPYLFVVWIFAGGHCHAHSISLTHEYQAVTAPMGALYANVWAEVPCHAYPTGTQIDAHDRDERVLPPFRNRTFQRIVPGHTRIGGVLPGGGWV